MKFTVPVVPIGVVTLTVLVVRKAPFVMAQFAWTVVEVAVTPVHVTPLPDTVTAVAPLRLVPVRVTGTVVLCRPEAGLMDVSVAPCTVKVRTGVVPPGVDTVTL